MKSSKSILKIYYCLTYTLMVTYITNTKPEIIMFTKIRVPFRLGDEINSTIHSLLGNLSDQANLKESYEQGGIFWRCTPVMI